MTVIILENAPEKLRGYLARYLLQIHTNVFVGTASSSTRGKLWKTILDNIEGGFGLIIYERKRILDFRTIGENRREPIEIDKIVLSMFKNINNME